MDFDFTWKDPTEAQIAALKHAHRCLGGKDDTLPPQDTWHSLAVSTVQGRAYMVDNDRYDYKLNEFDLAEMMLVADGSLWYTQAKTWRENPPEEHGESYQRITQLASAFVQRIVEWGYRDSKWWDLEAIHPNIGLRVLGISSLLEFNRMTYELTHIRDSRQALRVLLYTEGQLPLVSAGWRMLPTLLVPRLNVSKVTKLLGGDTDTTRLGMAEIRAYFDPEFRKKLGKARLAARKATHETYEPTECIHPECDNLVAPTGIKPREGHHKNYRGTGACRKGHNSYFCTRCNVPHSHATKTGKAHYQLYYGKDFDGTDMEGRKWTRG